MQERVYEKRVNDVDRRAVSAPVECVALAQHWTKRHDEAIDQWCARLTACVRAKGGHFEHLM